MIGKVGGLARALGLILAVIAAFVAIPGVDVALVLVVLGLIAGLVYTDETTTRLILVVLVLPAVGAALGTIPAIGSQLSTVATNAALAAAGAAATVLAIRFYNLVKDGIIGLAAK